MTKKTKIAIFGGAFNPPTIGHQQIVNRISDDFDEVWIMPCNKHRYKKDIVSNKLRLEMLNSLEFEKDNVIISDFEIRNDLNGRLYETMVLLKSIYKDCEFHIIFGSDNLNNIETFFEYQKLIDENNFGIIYRKGEGIDFDLYYKYFDCDKRNNKLIPNLDEISEISSSFVRENVNDRCIYEYVGASVMNIIKSNNLYQK